MSSFDEIEAQREFNEALAYEEWWDAARARVSKPRVHGCPIHDLTYFHGDQRRHDGMEYPPCEECVEDE